MNSNSNNSPGPGRQNNFGLSTIPKKNKSNKIFQQHSGRRLFQKEESETNNNDHASIGSNRNIKFW